MERVRKMQVMKKRTAMKSTKLMMGIRGKLFSCRTLFTRSYVLVRMEMKMNAEEENETT